MTWAVKAPVGVAWWCPPARCPRHGEILGFELPIENPPGFFERNAALLLLALVALAAAGFLAWLTG